MRYGSWMAEPAAPDRETREHLYDVLAELIARGGASSLLRAPVMPGEAAFPEPWAPSRTGVKLLLLRLLWHAGIDRAVEIDDRRSEGAPPTERKPATCVAAIEIRKTEIAFALGFVGTDDVVGTLAHEVGVAHAALNRPEAIEPYRSAELPMIAVDPDVDFERGSLAAVYLGLGVLAANAAFQQYSRSGQFTGAYYTLEYDVLRAGYLPMSALAFLLAVQAIVRGDSTPPKGLSPPQRDEVAAWMAVLPEAKLLRVRLGIRAEAEPEPRPAVVAFADAELEHEAPPAKIAFRWQTNRAWLGMFAGTVLGVGVAVIVSRGLMPPLALGGGVGGHVVGRSMRRKRCSGCATMVAADATTCRHCGAALRGDIAHLSDRLEAEERLTEADTDQHPDA
ncbi:MAG: hypothetical protein JWO36_498 [Myxococcales bacterium]|nr:hypothetical protein [Myxococcales bacterium]